MAIDTSQKRSSAAFPGLPIVSFISPDVGIDQGERQAIVWVYAGVSGLGSPVATRPIISGGRVPWERGLISSGLIHEGT